MKGRRIDWLPEELAWIEARKDWPRADLHRAFVAHWKRSEISQGALKGLCTRKGWRTGRTGCFRKGQVSHNAGKKGLRYPGSEKGWFRKGERSGVAVKLYQPIGTERITKDGYRQRKVNDDLPLQSRWKMVQLLEWEAVNGPLPSGHVLKSLDGNRLNTDPANWVAIPRGMLPRLNGKHRRAYDSAPAELRETIMAIARLEHAARQAAKQRQA